MRTMFVNPASRRNAPMPWASLYRRAHPKSPAAMAAKHKGKKTLKRSKKSKPSAKHARRRVAKKHRTKTGKLPNPRTVTLSLKDMKSMLSNRRNPKYRARKSSRRGRARRRNAGITPFIQANPYAFSNPRGRLTRRRRRNPGLALPRLSLNRVLSKTMTYGGGAALGTVANIFALNKIGNHYLRNGARILTACVGAPMLNGELGAAAAGALLSPMVIELASFLKLPVATDADLQDLLDEIDGGSDETMQVDADLFG